MAQPVLTALPRPLLIAFPGCLEMHRVPALLTKVEQAQEEVRQVAGILCLVKLPHLRQQHHHQQPGCTKQPGSTNFNIWHTLAMGQCQHHTAVAVRNPDGTSRRRRQRRL